MAVQEGEEGEAMKRSKGVGFVRYFNKEPMRTASWPCAPPLSSPCSSPLLTPPPPPPRRLSLLAHTDSSITLDGRQLSIALAVSRTQASALQAKPTRGPVDKRNLYLAREGVILRGGEGAEGLSEEEVAAQGAVLQGEEEEAGQPQLHGQPRTPVGAQPAAADATRRS